MKELKVKNLETLVPPGTAFRHESAPFLPKLHTNTLLVGKRGSGKTVMVYNLLKRFNFDRIFVISPTFDSNKEIMKEFNILDSDVYQNLNDDSCITDITAKVQGEADDLTKYRQQIKEYNRFKQLLKSDKHVSDDLLETFYTGNGFAAPTHKYDGREPVMALFIDDGQSSNLFRSKKLLNTVILHRHLGSFVEGGALGLSLFIATQNYTAMGGIPKAIRGNVTNLILFRNKNQKELDQIAAECSGEISPEEFLAVFHQAIQGPHDCLFVDFHKKEKHPSQFRRGLDTFLVPEIMHQ